MGRLMETERGREGWERRGEEGKRRRERDAASSTFDAEGLARRLSGKDIVRAADSCSVTEGKLEMLLSGGRATDGGEYTLRRETTTTNDETFPPRFVAVLFDRQRCLLS